MTKTTSDNILSQILSCLDTAAGQQGLITATFHQTEGYLRGLQGLAWVTPIAAVPSSEEPAKLFLYDIRNGSVALRGRIKKESKASVSAFLQGLEEGFPGSGRKHFSGALSRLWVRWQGHHRKISRYVGVGLGRLLHEEYAEGAAGRLSTNDLDHLIHLRRIRDYLRMRGWLKGMIEFLHRRSDWKGRELAKILEGNFSSITLLAIHSGNVDYAAEVLATLPAMIEGLDQAIERLATTEPETAHFLRKNRSTVLTRALHSGNLEYPTHAADQLPDVLKTLRHRIKTLEESSPEDARHLRSNLNGMIYRALTNGHLEELK